MFVQGWTPHDAAQSWGAEPGGTAAVASELSVPFLEADFADAESPERVVAAAVDALGPLDPLRRELDEYFEGRRHSFDLDLDLRTTPDYHRRVLAALNEVEYGHTTTYGALAMQTGNPRAARAVGTVMNRNPIPIVLPCHRVVGATGALVGYAGGLDRKRTLLAIEGVDV